MPKMVESSNWKRLDKYLAKFNESAQTATLTAAQALASDIKANWSPNSPSSEGAAPAVVTGNLNSAIIANEDGKGELASLKTTDTYKVSFVHADAEDGKDPGDRGNYGAILEEGMDRDFMEPAIERLSPLFGDIFKRSVSG